MRQGDEVSIHASVKDATGRECRVRQGDEVSIHASVKDATRDASAIRDEAMFQSTRP